MPHVLSPPGAAFTDPSTGLGSPQVPREMPCTSLPLRLHSSLHSAFTKHPGKNPSTPAAEDPKFPSDRQAPQTPMTAPNSERMQWAVQNALPLSNTEQARIGFHSPLDYYQQAQNDMCYNGNFNLTYSGLPYDTLDLSQIPNGLPGNALCVEEAYPPAAYHVDPPKLQDVRGYADCRCDGQLMQLNDDYDQDFGAHNKMIDHSCYTSPPYYGMERDCTPHDDMSPYTPSYKRGDSQEFPIDKDQPYAQLIYRALLGAPNRTMILKDIYDWFRRNTDKAAAETKGWQNSIRHNLSMNGAFEKVDQPSDESRKGFMWRLTPEAIQSGVKSTTRYRSKQPSKRNSRTAQPQPQRQASGSKGGHASRRSANLRRRTRGYDAYRGPEPFPRSVPTSDAHTSPSYPPNHNLSYGGSGGNGSPAPYYADVDLYAYDAKPLDLSASLLAAGRLDLYSGSATRHSGSASSTSSSLPASPLAPSVPSPYAIDGLPSEPLFSASDSPSPTADSPQTPDAQRAWDDDALGPPACGIYDDMCGYVG